VAAIEAALQLDTPINAGLIGVGLDTSLILAEYLGTIADNPLVEIVSHSYYHKSFEGKTIEYQEEDLRLLNDMANKVLYCTVLYCTVLYYVNTAISKYDKGVPTYMILQSYLTMYYQYYSTLAANQSPPNDFYSSQK
jgi:hypothetical protein